jgi:hypothetical protein
MASAEDGAGVDSDLEAYGEGSNDFGEEAQELGVEEVGEESGVFEGNGEEGLSYDDISDLGEEETLEDFDSVEQVQQPTQEPLLSDSDKAEFMSALAETLQQIPDQETQEQKKQRFYSELCQVGLETYDSLKAILDNKGISKEIFTKVVQATAKVVADKKFS